MEETAFPDDDDDAPKPYRPGALPPRFWTLVALCVLGAAALLTPLAPLLDRGVSGGAALGLAAVAVLTVAVPLVARRVRRPKAQRR